MIHLWQAFLLIGFILLPFSTSPSSGAVVSFGLPALLICALLFLPYLIINYNKLSAYSVFFGGGYVLSIVIYSIVAPSPLQSAARVLPNLIGFIIFLGVLISLKTKLLDELFILRVLMFFGATLSLYYVINISYQSMNYGLDVVLLERFTGGLSGLPWGASNVISAVLLFSLFATIQKHVTHPGKLDKLFLVLIVIGVLSTLSRTGFLLLIVTLFFLMFDKRFSRIAFQWSLLILVVVLLAVAIGYNSGLDTNNFTSLIESRTSSEEIVTGNSRLDSWIEKLNYIYNHPFQPIGYYGSLFVFDGLSAHNFFITTLLEMGPPGFIISVLFLFYPLYALKRSQSACKNGDKIIFYGLVIILINLQVEDPNYTQPYIFAFWLYMAVIYGRLEEWLSC